MAKKKRLVLVAGVSVLLAAAGADAQTVAFSVLEGPYSFAELNRLDPATGVLVPVGPVGYPVTHIAFDDQGSLFGADGNTGRLLAMDRTHGTGVPIGDLGSSIIDVAGLTFDAAGQLWMTAIDDVLGPSLFEVDTATGAALWVTGIDVGDFGALASDGDTVFIAGYRLGHLDTSDGSVAPVPGSTLGIWTGRALDIDHRGHLWGLMLCGPCMTPYDILTTVHIDPTTGLIDGDGSAEPHGTWGLAILPGAVFVDGFESGDITAWSSLPFNRSLATATHRW